MPLVQVYPSAMLLLVGTFFRKNVTMIAESVLENSMKIDEHKKTVIKTVGRNAELNAR